MCLLYDGSTRRLTESGFMEKSGIEPATTGLKDIGLSPTPRRLHPNFLCSFPGYKPALPGWFKICVLVLCREHSKAHRKWFYGEAGNRTCDPLFTRHRFSPTPPTKKCDFSMGSNQYWAGSVYCCVCYTTAASHGIK